MPTTLGVSCLNWQCKCQPCWYTLKKPSAKAGGMVADEIITLRPNMPAKCTKRPIATKSCGLKSSTSSITKSEDNKRKHGKMYLPPRTVSVAAIMWSMVQTNTGLNKKAWLFAA